MKYNIDRIKMILKILSYLVLYGVFVVCFLCYDFKRHVAFDFFSFIIYSILALFFINMLVMLVFLIWELIAEKGENHTFAIVQLVVSAALNIIVFICFYKLSNISIF